MMTIAIAALSGLLAGQVVTLAVIAAARRRRFRGR